MRRRLAVLGMLPLLLAPVVAAPAAAAAPPPATVRFVRVETGKYYVVGPAVNGQQEYLFAIAAKTLGDGNRAEEIFALNQGRLQPDGERMTSPTTLKPGWILILPEDASGDGVRNGAPPKVEEPPATGAPATPSPGAEGDAAPGGTANAGGPADRSELDFLWSPTALRVALIVLAILLLIWAQLALQSRRRPVRRARPVPAGESSGEVSVSGGTRTQVISAVTLPEQRRPARLGFGGRRRETPAAPPAEATFAPPTFAPAPEPAPTFAPPVPAAPPVLEPLPPRNPPPAPPKKARPAEVAPPTAPAPAETPAPPPVKAPAAPPAKAPAAPPAKAPAATPAKKTEAPVKAAPEVSGGSRSVPAMPRFENYDGPAETSFLSAIALPRPGGHVTELMPSPPNPFATLVTDLICGGVPATVRLIGARPARWGSAHGWLAEGESPPPSSTPVVLGAYQGRRLWADLTVAPDVLVLGGDPDAARALGRDLAGQLAGAAEVVVAGEVLGGSVPDGVRRIGSVSELGLDRPAAATRVLICDAAGAEALFARLRTVPASRGRTVPVVIGEAPAARWSVRLIGDPVPSEAGPAAVQSSAS